MRNDFEFFRFSSVQHPEMEKVMAAIKETGRIEWLNYDRANHVTQDYLAYAKDPEGFGPNVQGAGHGDVPRGRYVPVADPGHRHPQRAWMLSAVLRFIQGGHWSMLDHPDDVNVS